MNLISVSRNVQFAGGSGLEYASADERYRAVLTVITDAGGVQVTASTKGEGCHWFLIDTPALLRALSESPPFEPRMRLLVFSLAAPELQLAGIQTGANPPSAEFYRIDRKPSSGS